LQVISNFSITQKADVLPAATNNSYGYHRELNPGPLDALCLNH